MLRSPTHRNTREKLQQPSKSTGAENKFSTNFIPKPGGQKTGAAEFEPICETALLSFSPFNQKCLKTGLSHKNNSSLHGAQDLFTHLALYVKSVQVGKGLRSQKNAMPQMDTP